MVATARQPVTAARLKALMQNAEIVRIPATLDEFWTLIELPEYRMNYYQNEMVCSISYASTNHERIVRNFITAFDLAFSSKGETFGSYRPIYADECEDIFECDVHVVMGNLEEYHYKRKKTATSNPSIIVEVLSDSTKSFDISNKLPCYKAISTVQHILYIEPNALRVSVYSRSTKNNVWINEDFNDINQRIKLNGKYFPLKQIYKNVILGI
jgi:Uma2 family endonuclease